MDIFKLLGLDFNLISLDKEKAFDWVEHQYLLNTLEWFGLNQIFTAWIKVLCSNIENVLKINVVLSAPFNVHRGIRQGCPMSRMLYSIETMLRDIGSRIEAIPGFPN